MTPTQLRVLVAVADCGSFSRAATDLGQSQPYVSRTIRALEDAFGGSLFARTSAGVAATDLGREAMHRARRALRELEGLRQMTAEAGAPLKGALRVAAPASLANWPLPRALSRLRRRHPDLTARVFEGDPDELAAWLNEGAADVALATRPLPGWSWTVLGEEPFVVAGALPEGEAPIAMDEIGAWPLILSSCGIERVLSEAFAARGLSLQVVHRSRAYSTVFAMVEEGLGFTIVPASLAGHAARATAVRSIADGPARTVGILSPAMPSRAVAAFLAEMECAWSGGDRA